MEMVDWEEIGQGRLEKCPYFIASVSQIVRKYYTSDFITNSLYFSAVHHCFAYVKRNTTGENKPE